MSGDDVVSERLRDAYGALLQEGALPGPDCADPERIWAAVRGDLARAEARALIDHALACPACGAAWRLARELAAEAGGSPEVAGTRWEGRRWLALAAAAIVVALIPVGLYLRRAPGTPAYRDEGRVEIRSLIPEGRLLPRRDFLLRWTPGPHGARFTLRVVRPDLSVVANTKGLKSPEYLVPPEVLRDLPPGQVLYWQVEAHLEDGSRLVSGMFSVQLE
jgi:hypothetical protein